MRERRKRKKIKKKKKKRKRQKMLRGLKLENYKFFFRLYKSTESEKEINSKKTKIVYSSCMLCSGLWL